MSATVRCADCRSEFTAEQIENANACPTCGTRGVPMSIADDVQITINWHELRILCMWADNWAEKFCDPDARRTLASILRQIVKQHPGRSALTMGQELQEVADAFGTVQVVDGEQTRTIVGRKPS